MEPVLTANQKRVLKALPSTGGEMAKTVPLSSKTITKILEALERMGLAHISAWSPPKNGGRYSAYYTAGPGERAQHPCGEKKAVQTIEQDGRRFHILGDDVKYAIRMEPTPVQRDPMVAALFGPAA
jgi:hypothetical protein